MKYVLDRFEGEYAILEQEGDKDLVLLRNKLPSGAKEGDIIALINNSYIIDVEATKEAKNRISEKMKKLFKN